MIKLTQRSFTKWCSECRRVQRW